MGGGGDCVIAIHDINYGHFYVNIEKCSFSKLCTQHFMVDVTPLKFELRRNPLIHILTKLHMSLICIIESE